MTDRTKAYAKFFLLSIIVLGIVGYSLYQARNLIEGPKITLTSPSNGATITDPLVHIQGTAKNITFISINNNQIYVDNAGKFDEDLLASPGYNSWVLEARDKFGRTVRKNIELVFMKS